MKTDNALQENILYYLAYGSNLHPVRLSERVASAELLGVVELRQYRLAFQKKGWDGSSKCNLVHTGETGDGVYAAMYSIATIHKADLDRFEGKGQGYDDVELIVKFQGKLQSCFTYFAQPSHIAHDLRPYHWYKNLVLLGARHLQFPEAYVYGIEALESMDDPDEGRRHTHDQLLDRMRNFK